MGLILDYYVYQSVRQLKRDAVPGVKWQVFELRDRHGVDVLPQHPESWSCSSKDEPLYVVYPAAGAWLGVPVVFSFRLFAIIRLIDLRRGWPSAQRTGSGLPHLSNWVFRLRLLVWLVLIRFPIDDIEIVSIMWQIHQCLKLTEVLDILIQAIVVLEALDLVFRQVVYRVDHFIVLDDIGLVGLDLLLSVEFVALSLKIDDLLVFGGHDDLIRGSLHSKDTVN